MGHAVIAVYASQDAAEAAIRDMEWTGFEMKHLSVVGPDLAFPGDTSAGGPPTFREALRDLRLAPASFWIPGPGSLVVAGRLAGRVRRILEGALVAGGLGLVGAALHGMGIPRDSIHQCEAALERGRFVLIAHGSWPETVLAREILHRTAPETLDHPPRGAAGPMA